MSDKIVKSVRRVFEVLELFGREQRPLPAVDVARKLEFPLTSTHAILKSMRALGYLSYEESTWSYFPAHTLPNLVEWVRDSIAGEIDLLDFLTALSRQTGETINLSRRINDEVKIIYGLESSHPVGVFVSMGTLMPIGGSLTGLTALACLDSPTRKELLETLRSSTDAARGAFDADQYASVSRSLRRDGMVMRCDVYIRGVGAICIPVMGMGIAEPLVVGIVGPSDRIKENETAYKRDAKTLIRKLRIRTFFRR